MLMAIPQWAMAQAGSDFRTCSNWRWDSSYQKSWTRAMPRLMATCCDATQETGKETIPRRSGVSVKAGRAHTNVTSIAAKDFIVTEYSRNGIRGWSQPQQLTACS